MILCANWHLLRAHLKVLGAVELSSSATCLQRKPAEPSGVVLDHIGTVLFVREAVDGRDSIHQLPERALPFI